MKYTKTFITTKRGYDLERKKMTFQMGKRHSERFYEVTKVPESITERFPLHAGNCILHLSKQILADFVLLMHDNLRPDSFKFCYSGNA